MTITIGKIKTIPNKIIAVWIKLNSTVFPHSIGTALQAIVINIEFIEWNHIVLLILIVVVKWLWWNFIVLFLSIFICLWVFNT